MECWLRWCDVLPKIAFGSDRASSFLLGDFAKGTGGWGFCRYTANYLAILMALSADDSKGVLEKAGGGSTVLETRSLRFSGIYILYH